MSFFSAKNYGAIPFPLLPALTLFFLGQVLYFLPITGQVPSKK